MEFELKLIGDEVVAVQMALLFAYETGEGILSEKVRAQIREVSGQFKRTK